MLRAKNFHWFGFATFLIVTITQAAATDRIACELRPSVKQSVDFAHSTLRSAASVSSAGAYALVSLRAAAPNSKSASGALELVHFGTKRRIRLPAGAAPRSARFSPDESTIFIGVVGQGGLVLDLTAADPLATAKKIPEGALASVRAVSNKGKIFGETSLGVLAELDPATGAKKDHAYRPAREGGAYLALLGETGATAAYLDAAAGEVRPLPEGRWKSQGGQDFAVDGDRVFHFPSGSMLTFATREKILGISRDGARLLTSKGSLYASGDRAKPSQTLHGLPEAEAADFAPDGKSVALALREGVLRIDLRSEERMELYLPPEAKLELARGRAFWTSEKGTRLELKEAEPACLAPLTVKWPEPFRLDADPKEIEAEIAQEVACAKPAAKARAESLLGKADSSEGISPDELRVLLYLSGAKGALGAREIERVILAALRQQPAWGHEYSGYIKHALAGLARASARRHRHFEGAQRERIRDVAAGGRELANTICEK